ncbi:calcium-binding protein P-like [Scleropages formosus]|uniref:Calcium-binding protein P-like n=1 Tax=Scleropages formosus TaxID=113540 RepID=A0A0P7XI66_SCLFO|nr:calcium-binding protein P-like [Scleropages formosus]
MGQLSYLIVLCLVLLLLHGHSGRAGRSSSSRSKTSSSSKSSGSSSSSKSSGSSSSSKSTGSGHKTSYSTKTNAGTSSHNPTQHHPDHGSPHQFPNKNPAAAAGGYPNQYPGAGGYPYHYPGRGGVSPGGYPKQYPSAGNFPGGGAAYPSDKILSPRYGWGYSYGASGVGGSPFSRKVQSKGHFPSEKSKGFGKKAAVAAGLGVMTGAAVGYGVGRYSSPKFGFQNPMEEQFYNYYMYNRYNSNPTHIDHHHKPTQNSGKRKNYNRNNPSRNNPSQNNPSQTDEERSPAPAASPLEDDNDTVSIVEIGYPELVEQLKIRRCVELYTVYEEQRQKNAERVEIPFGSGVQQHPLCHGVVLLFTTALMVLSSTLLLH